MALDDLPIPPTPPYNPPSDPTPPETATVNILDTGSNIIGVLTYIVGTPINIINQILSQYSSSIVSPTLALINTIILSQTATATTSAATPTPLGGMSCVPAKGTYLAFFSGSVNTTGSSASGTFGIYVNGSLLPETNRPVSCNLSLLGGLVSVSINSIGVGTYTGTQVTLDGNSTLDVRFASTNGGVIGFAERTFTMMKVG